MVGFTAMAGNLLQHPVFEITTTGWSGSPTACAAKVDPDLSRSPI